MRASAELITKTITKYLEKHSLQDNDPPWEIRRSPLGGYGLFTARPITGGEVIFKDHPLILGPRSGPDSPSTCASCYKSSNLKVCERRCGLQLCSSKCQNSSTHIKECKVIRQWQTRALAEEPAERLAKVLLLIRSLLLGDEDKEVVRCLKAHSPKRSTEVDTMKNVLRLDLKEDEEAFMRFVSSILDANAFEVVVNNDEQSSIKGLYSLASLVNHSCTPNAFYVFGEGQNLIIRASRSIPQGSEIFYSYARPTWGTPTRRLYLYKTKHFLCNCERCRDSTEFGSYISAFRCKFCKRGRVVPFNPLLSNGRWLCKECGRNMDSKDVAMLASALGSVLTSVKDEDVDLLLKLVEERLPALTCRNNESVLALKYKIIWILGRRSGFTWTELPDGLLDIKGKLCEELLLVLENLRLGQCKMRGLLLYELYSCSKEKRRREEKSGNVSKLYDDMRKKFLEAADILMFDAAAPDEIKLECIRNKTTFELSKH